MPVISGTGQLPPGGLPSPTDSGKAPLVQKVSIPGPPGPPGANAFTKTIAAFSMPPADSATTASVSVEDTSWMGIGQPVYIENAGTLFVSSIDNSSTVNVVNGGATGNASPATSIPLGSKFSPGGVPAGAVEPTFAISTFSIPAFGSGVVEVGASIVNPMATMSYTITPTSASLATVNPTTSQSLTTPFTSATITGTFTSAVDGTSGSATLDASKGIVNSTATRTLTFVGAIVAGSTTNLTPGQVLYDSLAGQQRAVVGGRSGVWTFSSAYGFHQVFGFLHGRGTPSFKDTLLNIQYTATLLGNATITENGTPQSVDFYDVAVTGFHGQITSS